MATEKPIHVIIVGAGLTGLLFAQALRKLNLDLEAQGLPPKFTFDVYERDESQFFRGGGFSLTIHWGISFVERMLPKELTARLYECVGNQRAMESGEMGHFTYFNLRNGEHLHRNPVPPDWRGCRMARIKFIKLLMTGLNVQYSKRLMTLSCPDEDHVTAYFEDGTEVTGDLLIGADGSRSAVRQFLYGPEHSQNTQIPVRMINTRAEYPIDEIKDCLAIDPHTFHGGDPEQNGYFFFAFLDLPPEDSGKPAAVQMTFTWPFEAGYLGEEDPMEPPGKRADRLALLKRMAKDWCNPVGDLVRRIPDDCIEWPVTIAEWIPSDVTPLPTNGRVTMVGDAAHLMTSFRGENANHGVVDVASIVDRLAKPGVQSSDVKRIIIEYEQEMEKRTRPATRKARQACIDANHYNSVKVGSPFLARRQMFHDDA